MHTCHNARFVMPGDMPCLLFCSPHWRAPWLQHMPLRHMPLRAPYAIASHAAATLCQPWLRARCQRASSAYEVIRAIRHEMPYYNHIVHRKLSVLHTTPLLVVLFCHAAAVIAITPLRCRLRHTFTTSPQNVVMPARESARCRSNIIKMMLRKLSIYAVDTDRVYARFYAPLPVGAHAIKSYWYDVETKKRAHQR